MERLERTPQWHFDWLRHQTRDAFWLHGSPIADYAAITCPTLLIGGWLDGYVDGMLALAEHLDCPTRTVIGPWGHRRPATGVPAPTLDHYDLLARWFGHHLRGDDNGVMEMPPVVVYIQDPSNDTHRVPGRWRAENEWPPADAGLTEWILADLDHGPTVWAGPQWVGIHAPAWDRAEEPVESSTVDDEASVTFQIDPLEEAVEILGTVEVEVNVASDASVGMVAARLVAVSPAGDTVLVSRGNRNLAFPSNLSDPVAIEPGSAVTVRFPLLACSAVIPAGWSLRLALSGADFPVVWPPGGSFTLTFDAARSRLLVPTVPSRPDDRWLDLPEAGSPPATPVESVRSVSERSVDRYEGLTVYRRIVGSTEVQPDRHDLTYSADQEWTVSVADVDPAGMAARAVSAMRLERPGWSVGANGSLDLTTDGEHFHLTIELTATLDDTDVFQRTWRESITRRWA
jgi:putative CocE/NonD family hydrolase